MRKFLLLIFMLLFVLSIHVNADDYESAEQSVDIIVETAPLTLTPITFADNTIDPDVVFFDKSVRSVDEYTITQWAETAHVITDEDIAKFSQPCTWEQFFTFLWRTNGAPVRSSINFEDDYQKEQESILAWAQKTGLASATGGKQQMASVMRHGDAQWAFWHLKGEPEPSTNAHNLPIGVHEKAELWSCDVGFIVREEQMNSNPDKTLSVKEALTYLYYSYHRRSETAFRITVDQFLSACQNVMDTARMYGYRYGDSHAANPTTDGIISCDRLIAKALYDLGYTSQPTGGITCGNADQYLSAWGFERSTSLASARRGSIMLVKHAGKSYTSHMFVFAGNFDMNTMTGDRYDAGSQYAINSQQPLRGLSFWYNPYDVIVYNIPE